MNITSKPVSVKPTTGYVSSGITELQPIEVRTFKKVEGSLKESTQVKCELKGRGYTAMVVSPGMVNIPVYGKKSPAIISHCANGDLSGTSSATVANLDLERRQASTSNAGAGGGLIGSLIASAISANMKERKGDRFAYKPINVTITTK